MEAVPDLPARETTAPPAPPAAPAPAPWSSGRIGRATPHARLATPVYLARHGQTESNLLRRYAGYSPEPLTEAGRAQMSGLAARLALCRIGEVWTSEVARSRESAELIAGIMGVSIRTEARLNEIRMGPWEGLTEAEVAHDFPNAWALWCTLPDRLELAGRETLQSLSRRVTAAVADAAERPHPVLLVSHVAPIRVAVLMALGLPLSTYKRLHVGNGDAVLLDRAGADVRRLGETGSLRAELPLFSAESSLA